MRTEDVTPRLVDPLEASRHPFEVYLLVMAAVSGVPLLLGKPNSGSVQDALPPAMTALWGAMLVMGSTLALVGLYWRGRRSTGLLMERTGLIGVGGAALVYACILLTVGWRGVFAACIIGAFGLACITQARRISQRIHAVIQHIDHGHD